MNDKIFVGTYGYVLCIDQSSGKELWRTSLTGVGYGSVTIYYEDNKVYCGSNGFIFILCALTGKILAENELVGYGYGTVTFTSKKSEPSSQYNQQQQQPQQLVQQPQLIQFQSPVFLSHPQMIQQPQLLQTQMFPQPLLSQPSINQSQGFPQLIPSFPSNSDLYEEEVNQKMPSDSEYARLLDVELNGMVSNNNHNNQQNNRHQQHQQQPQYQQQYQQQYQVLVSPRTVHQVNITVDDLIFVGLNSYVVALNKHTGERVWRYYIYNVGQPLSLTFSKGKLLVGACGHLYCVDPLTGTELWYNEISGLRYRNVSVITTNNNNIASQSNAHVAHIPN